MYEYMNVEWRCEARTAFLEGLGPELPRLLPLLLAHDAGPPLRETAIVLGIVLLRHRST
jgi:hypothetical protein